MYAASVSFWGTEFIFSIEEGECMNKLLALILVLGLGVGFGLGPIGCSNSKKSDEAGEKSDLSFECAMPS